MEQTVGERSMSVLSKLLEKEGDEAFEYLLEIDREEFYAVAALIQDKVMDGDKGLTALFERASARRKHMEMMEGGMLYDTFLSYESPREREEYRQSLNPEHKTLLDKTMWAHKSGGEALGYLLGKSLVPTPKKAVAAVAMGGLATGGAAIAGSSTLPAVGTGVCAAIMTDLIITGFEEDEATKRFGKGLRSLFVDKPKNWLQRLMVKEQG